MENEKKSNWKNYIDNALIYNLYILIIGAIFLLISILLSINGNSKLFNLFEKLWYPVFIPALSLFFTAIFIEVILSKLKKYKDNQ